MKNQKAMIFLGLLVAIVMLAVPLNIVSISDDSVATSTTDDGTAIAKIGDTYYYDTDKTDLISFIDGYTGTGNLVVEILRDCTLESGESLEINENVTIKIAEGAILTAAYGSIVSLANGIIEVAGTLDLSNINFPYTDGGDGLVAGGEGYLVMKSSGTFKAPTVWKEFWKNSGIDPYTPNIPSTTGYLGSNESGNNGIIRAAEVGAKVTCDDLVYRCVVAFAIDDTFDKNIQATNWTTGIASITTGGATAYYNTLQDAINAVSTNDVIIKVLDDITLTEGLKITGDKDITINFNNKNLIGNSVNGTTGLAANLIQAGDNTTAYTGNLIIKNCVFSENTKFALVKDEAYYNFVQIFTSGNVTIDSCVFNKPTDDRLNRYIRIVTTNERTSQEIKIEGCTFNGNSQSELNGTDLDIFKISGKNQSFTFDANLPTGYYATYRYDYEGFPNPNAVGIKAMKNPVASITTGETTAYYEFLQDAINQAKTNDIITLLFDVTENVTIPAEKTIKIDLAGKEWSAKTDKDGNTITNNTITNNGTLTIIDNEGNTGKVHAPASSKYAAIKNENGATAYLRGGTWIQDSNPNSYYLIKNVGTMFIGNEEGLGIIVIGTSTKSSVIANGWYDYATETSGNPTASMTIYGISFDATTANKSDATSSMVKNDEGGELTIKGGNFIDAAAWIVLNWNDLTIEGGTFGIEGNTQKIIGTYAGTQDYLKGKTVITGGTFNGNVHLVKYADSGTYSGWGSISIEGGTFNGSISPIAADGATYDYSSGISITGGTFSTNPSKYVANDNIAIENGGTYRVDELNETNAIAKIDTTLYNSLENAFKNAVNDNKVVLVSKIVNVSEIIVVDKNVTLDLSGKTINAKDRVFNIYGGNLTIIDSGTNGTINVEGTEADDSMIKVGDEGSGTLTINGGTFNSSGYGIFVATNGNATISGGNFTTVESCVSGNGTDSNATITITGGTFRTTTDVEYTVYFPSTESLTITGGTFNSGIEIKSGTVSISGTTEINANGQIINGNSSNGNSTTGYAIAIVNNNSYTGNISLTISDSAEINGEIGIVDDGATGQKVTLTINGGIFNKTTFSQSETDYKVSNFVTGGKFNTQIAQEYLATGYRLVGPTSGYYTPSNVYTVTFNTNGGDVIDSQSIVYNITATTPTDPTKDGYSFVNWYSDSELMTEFDFSTVITEDITLYAQWKANTPAAPTLKSYADKKVTLTPMEGYEYRMGTKGSWTTSNIFENVTSNTQFYQRVKATDISLESEVSPVLAVTIYSVAYDTNGGTGTTPETQYIDATNSVTIYGFDGITKEGHSINVWNTQQNGSGTDVAPGSYTPTANVTLYAKWEINQYTITFITGVGETGVVSSTQSFGTSIKDPTSLTREGYEFTGWDKQIPVTMPAENVTITAIWAPNPYTIKFDANGGDGSMSDISAKYGTSYKLTSNAFTYTGYQFVGWNTVKGGGLSIGDFFTDGETVSNLTSVKNETVTLYAVWNVVVSSTDGESAKTTIDDAALGNGVTFEITNDIKVSVDTTQQHFANGDALSVSVNKSYETEDSHVYTIKVVKNENTSVNGVGIHITLPLEEGMHNPKVVYIDENGVEYDMTTVSIVEGVSITFYTEHNSTYAVKYSASPAPSPSPSPGGGSTVVVQPNQAEQGIDQNVTFIAGVFILVFAILGFACMIRKM